MEVGSEGAGQGLGVVHGDIVNQADDLVQTAFRRCMEVGAFPVLMELFLAGHDHVFTQRVEFRQDLRIVFSQDFPQDLEYQVHVRPQGRRQGGFFPDLPGVEGDELAGVPRFLRLFPGPLRPLPRRWNR